MGPGAAWLRLKRRHPPLPLQRGGPEGISVVIPSRNGRELLAAQFPTLVEQSAGVPVEIIVVDNGSSDGTVEWLGRNYPAVRVVISDDPLSFSRAVNRGISAARYSHVCLLNNDMLLDEGFFAALWNAFRKVPDLFCATAQIRFPEGVRREETGKAVMAQRDPDDFPVRCDEPLPGEDLTWVLYGSGGCSLYDAAMLRALGNLDEAYEPAYVEDMDIGWRAWRQGWPSVYVAGAAVEHRHRATTSRYYTQAELDRVLEVNYLRFLVRAVGSPRLFRRLWREAVERHARTGRGPAPGEAARLVLEGGRRGRARFDEEEFLALTDGSVAVLPGRGSDILLLETGQLATPPAEMLARYEAVIVCRAGSDSKRRRAVERMAGRRWPRATLWMATGDEPARRLHTT